MSIASRLEFLLIPFKAQTIFTGRVNGTLTDPYMSVPYDGSSVTSNPLAGNTVWFGSTAGARDRGVLRLRSWNGSNQISVAENDDVTQYVQDNDFITIKQEWRLWPIYLRAVQSGTTVSIFQDYNVSWQRQTIDWKPVAVAGPPAVSEFNGTNFTAKFVGDRSFALASGATITAYLWTAPGSVEGTSTSQGTEASPVTFTWTTTGQKLVHLRVTDSNGNTHTNYTWAFGFSPNSPASIAYTDFDAFNDNLDFEQGGGSCSFTVHNDAAITDFPAECMVILASRGSQTTPTGYWPFRTNVHFVGYVVGKSVRQNPISGDVSFRATTIDGLMRNLTAFPASLTYKNSPNNWTTAANLTVDRAASYLWHYHSTLSLMTSIIPSNYSGLIQRQDFGPSSLYDQLQSELMASILGKVVSNHQSVLYHEIDYQMMLNAERAAVTSRKTLHKGVWVDDVNIEERDNYDWPTNQVKMSGVYYPGGSIEDVCPSFSEAPGNAPKVYGKERNYDRLIITSQSALNIRCGRALAKDIQDYPTVDMRFINDGSFTTVPQEIFPTRIEAGDNERGIAFSTSVLPRRISRNYDNYNGFIDVSVGFEPVTDGPPGVTVDLPCGPPEQKLGSREVPLERQEESGAGCSSLEIGSVATFETDGTTDESIVALSATKFITAYRTFADFFGNACVLDVSGTTVTPGTPVAFDSGGLVGEAAISITALSATKALVVWRRNDEPRAMVLDISGTVITTNTSVAIDLGYTGGGLGVVALSATKALAVYGLSTGTYTAVLDVSGSTITVNTPVLVSAIIGDNTAVCKISSTSAFASFGVTEGNPYGVVLSGITTTVTVGTPTFLDAVAAFTADSWNFAGLLDSARALVAYEVSDAIKAVIATISGTTVTAGTPVFVSGSDFALDELPSVAILSATRAIISFSQGQFAGAIPLTISGTDISAGDDIDIGTQETVSPATFYSGIAPISETSLVIAFCDVGDSGKGKAAVISCG